MNRFRVYCWINRFKKRLSSTLKPLVGDDPMNYFVNHDSFWTIQIDCPLTVRPFLGKPLDFDLGFDVRLTFIDSTYVDMRLKRAQPNSCVSREFKFEMFYRISRDKVKTGYLIKGRLVRSSWPSLKMSKVLKTRVFDRDDFLPFQDWKREEREMQEEREPIDLSRLESWQTLQRFHGNVQVNGIREPIAQGQKYSLSMSLVL